MSEVRPLHLSSLGRTTPLGAQPLAWDPDVRRQTESQIALRTTMSRVMVSRMGLPCGRHASLV